MDALPITVVIFSTYYFCHCSICFEPSFVYINRGGTYFEHIVLNIVKAPVIGNVGQIIF